MRHREIVLERSTQRWTLFLAAAKTVFSCIYTGNPLVERLLRPLTKQEGRSVGQECTLLFEPEGRILSVMLDQWRYDICRYVRANCDYWPCDWNDTGTLTRPSDVNSTTSHSRC